MWVLHALSPDQALDQALAQLPSVFREGNPSAEHSPSLLIAEDNQSKSRCQFLQLPRDSVPVCPAQQWRSV